MDAGARNPARAADLVASLGNFVRQDEAFHDAVVALHEGRADPSLEIYKAVLLSEEPSVHQRKRLMEVFGMDADARTLRRLRRLNFFELHGTMDHVDVKLLPGFIGEFRAAANEDRQKLKDAFWTNPLDLVRTVVGALHQFVLETRTTS
jgi:hypothetical protein